MSQVLSSNKTSDNSNLRDVQKVFNDGKVQIYEAHERVLGEQKVDLYFSRETLRFDRYLQAEQNNTTIERVIGVPIPTGIEIKPMDIAVIDGVQYIIRYIDFRDWYRPAFYKLALQRSTITYETDEY